MQTNLATLTKEKAEKFVVLREGPHHDLLKVCNFSHSGNSNNKNSQSDTDSIISNFLKQSLTAASTDERLAAAQQCIEISGGHCSLAWLVLAREGAENWQTAMLYAQKATQGIEREIAQNQFKKYSINARTLAEAMVDRGQITWNAGEKEEAVKIALTAMRDHDDKLWSENQIIVRHLAASLMIQNSEYHKAKNFLFDHPNFGEGWHYLNALAHFGIAGDTAISRGALNQAFAEGTITAVRLMDGKITERDQANDENGETSADLQKYFTDTFHAWQSVPSAIDWLSDNFSQPLSVAFRQSKAIARAKQDENRWARWESLDRVGVHFARTDKDWEAKNAFKAALREAERIEYTPYPFEQAVMALSCPNSECKKNHGLREKIQSRLKCLESQSLLTGPLGALHYASFCFLLAIANDENEALRCGERALAISSQLQSDQALDLTDDIQIRTSLAHVLFRMKKYEKVLEMVSLPMHTQNMLFGSKHFVGLPLLCFAYESNLALGRKEQADAIKSQLKTIESTLPPNPDLAVKVKPKPQTEPSLLARLFNRTKFARKAKQVEK